MKLKFWLIHGRKSFHSPSGAAAAPPVRKVNSSRTDHGREVVTNEGKNYRVLTLTCSQFEGFLGHPWNDNAALHSRFEILIESWSMIESIGYRPFSSILLVCKCNGKKRFEIQKKRKRLNTWPTNIPYGGLKCWWWTTVRWSGSIEGCVYFVLMKSFTLRRLHSHGIAVEGLIRSCKKM